MSMLSIPEESTVAQADCERRRYNRWKHDTRYRTPDHQNAGYLLLLVNLDTNLAVHFRLDHQEEGLQHPACLTTTVTVDAYATSKKETYNTQEHAIAESQILKRFSQVLKRFFASRQGLKPVNHAQQNVKQIRLKSQENLKKRELEAQKESTTPAAPLSAMANVKSSGYGTPQYQPRYLKLVANIPSD
jgi:hypothetical protein